MNISNRLPNHSQTNQQDNKSSWFDTIAQLPTNTFGMVLGLLALGLAWRYSSGQDLAVLPKTFISFIANGLFAIGGIVWTVLMLGYMGKWWRYRHLALQELHDKTLCCFLSLIPITTMLLALVLLPILPNVAGIMIVLGTLTQIAFAAYRTAGLWRGTHEATATTPIVYLPSVAANFVSCVCFATLGFSDIAWLFFGAGLLSWLSFEPAILQRLRNLPALEPAKRGILGIQLAPALIASNSYLSLTHGQIDGLLLILIGYGLLQLIYLIRLVPWIFQAGIHMSAWGFSFGLAAMASLGAHLLVANQQTDIILLGWLMFIVGSSLVILLLLLTLKWLIVWGLKRNTRSIS